jgi:prepilin-type N-terminal cleavage/methylation domain-containing protein
MPRWSVHLKSWRGFTQIELTITVVIVGVIAAVAAPSFSAWLRRQRLNEAFSRIEFAISQTQNEAIKRGRPCQLTIPPAGPTPTFIGDCLLSGDFTLEDVTLNTSPRAKPWIITFNASGENRDPDSAGTLWLAPTDAGSTQMQSKCLVMSRGIGLRRTGKLTADNDCLVP